MARNQRPQRYRYTAQDRRIMRRLAWLLAASTIAAAAVTMAAGHTHG